MKKRWIGIVLVGFLLVACSDDEVDEPDAGVEDVAVEDAQTEDTQSEDADSEDVSSEDADTGEQEPESALRQPVEVYTDDQGMPHIYAQTLEDLFYTNGYVQARDRLGQMEFYRRVATGTLSELLGELDESAISTDTMFRMLGLERSAKEYWEENYDPENESYIILESFAEGVTAFIDAVREGDEEISSTLSSAIPTDVLHDWEPWHSLAIARLLAVQLTYYTPMYLELTDLRQDILENLPTDSEDPAIAARAGAFNDLLRFAPATDTTHLDDFLSGALMETPPQAPTVDRDLLANAREMHAGIKGVPGAVEPFDPFNTSNPFMRGSNNWTVSGEHTDSGHPHVANDPHLGLSLPTVFYPMHLVLEDDADGREDIEVIGAAYAGTPGIVIGRNQDMAWGTTVGFYDYVDIYQEEVTGSSDDADPATVRFNDEDVEVERVVEEIDVGLLGNISETIEYTVEIVPHHGPLIPPSEEGRPVAREGTEAISVKWVGLEPSNEFEFLSRLWRAEEPDDVEEALTYYTVGSSNFVFGFTSGDIYYSGRSDIPDRPDSAKTFHPTDNPEGTAPVFVLPGDGTAEWEGFLADEDIPHALNPDKGYVITANNDPVGVTLENTPMEAENYLGSFFDIGFRGQTIENQFHEFIDNDTPMTLQDQVAIQDHPHDGMAAAFVPHVVAALDTVLDDEIADEEAPDLAAIRDEIEGQEERLEELRDLLDDWDYIAPATREPTGDDVARSSAAVLFNVATVYAIRNAFGDEMEYLDRYDGVVWSLPRASQLLSRSLLYLLEEPEEAISYDEDVGDSLYFDDLGNEDVTETRLTVLVRAVLQADDRLQNASLFGVRHDRDIPGPQSADIDDWIWGNLHGLTLDGLIPIPGPAFQRPEEGLPFYERPGGSWSVSPCGNGYMTFAFNCSSGSSLRMVHEMDPDGPVTYNAIPGGASEDPASPHFDDQIERWNDADPYLLVDDRDELADTADLEVFGE